MARIMGGELHVKVRRRPESLDGVASILTAQRHPHARQTCPVCQGRPDYTAHPDGVCTYGVRELAFTLRDLPACANLRAHEPGCGCRGTREPDFGDLRAALRTWAERQNWPMLVFFEYGRGASLRALHPHAHVLGVGWQCCVELGRMTWAEDHGNAHGGPWADIDDRQAVAELRVGYVSKLVNEHPLAHVGKLALGAGRQARRDRHDRLSDKLDIWAKVDPERKTGRLVQLL